MDGEGSQKQTRDHRVELSLGWKALPSRLIIGGGQGLCISATRLGQEIAWPLHGIRGGECRMGESDRGRWRWRWYSVPIVNIRDSDEGDGMVGIEHGG